MSKREKQTSIVKWYDKITNRLWDEFNIEIPLLSGVGLLDAIEDDLDLDMLVEELHDQKDMGESLDLYEAVKTVAMVNQGLTEEEFDFIYGCIY